MTDKIVKNFEIKKALGKDQINTQLIFTFAKSTTETLEKGVKYVQSLQ